MTEASVYTTWNAVRAWMLGVAGASFTEKFFVRRLSANLRKLRRSGRRPGISDAVRRMSSRLAVHAGADCAYVGIQVLRAATAARMSAAPAATRNVMAVHTSAAGVRPRVRPRVRPGVRLRVRPNA